MRSRTTQLLLKMTDRCNMRCSYCSDRPFRERPSTITPQVIAGIPRIFKLLAQRFSEIDVIFHGGEPFCTPPSLFDEVFAVLSDYHPFYSAQTNLYDIRPSAHANILSRLRSLSITVDGPRQIHDAHRLDCHGEGTFDRILKNLSSLRSEYPSLQINALFTVTPASTAFAHDIYQLFKELRIKHIGFNPVLSGPGSISQRDYIAFLKQLFALWVVDPDPLDVHLFSEVAKYFTGLQATPSTCYGPECYRNIISVSPAGNINPCMYWHDDSHFTVDTLTNLDDYWEYYSVKLSDRSLAAGCPDCEVFQFCRGGCPHEYSENQWLCCSALKAFLNHAEAYFTEQLTLAATTESQCRLNGQPR